MSKIFNRKLFRLNRQRGFYSVTNNFYSNITNSIIFRLSLIKNNIKNALIIGGPWLSKSPAPMTIYADYYPNKKSTNLVCEESHLPFKDKSFDLIISIIGLSTINNIEDSLYEIFRVLSPGGVFVATVIGEDSLSNIRKSFYEAEIKSIKSINPRFWPLLTMQSIGIILQKINFIFPVVDSEKYIVKFSNLNELTIFLRDGGLTNCSSFKTPKINKSLLELISNSINWNQNHVINLYYLIGFSPNK